MKVNTVLFTLLCLLFFNCGMQSDHIKTDHAPIDNYKSGYTPMGEIKLISSTREKSPNLFGVAIIEVRGHEYLTRYRGGTIHLESCPCKGKN